MQRLRSTPGAVLIYDDFRHDQICKTLSLFWRANLKPRQEYKSSNRFGTHNHVLSRSCVCSGSKHSPPHARLVPTVSFGRKCDSDYELHRSESASFLCVITGSKVLRRK